MGDTKNARDCIFERVVRLPNSISACLTPGNVSYGYSKNDFAHSILLVGVVCFGSSAYVRPKPSPMFHYSPSMVIQMSTVLVGQLAARAMSMAMGLLI